MARPVPIPFVGEAYQSRSLNLNAQRCLNLYLEQGGPDGKTPAALFGTPGLTRVVQFVNGNVEVRGMHVFRGSLWVIAGPTLYRIDSSMTAVSVGGIATSKGPVSFASSQNQMMLVDGDRGYYFDFPTQTFGVISDPDLPSGARQVSYLAASFLVEVPNTSTFAWSGINDVLSWNGADFASAEAAADPIVAHRTLFGEFFAIGSSTTEVFQADTKGFSRAGNAAIQQGCAAPFSVVQVDSALMWISRDEAGQGMVIRLEGYTPRRVSNHGIETALAAMPRISDAVAYAYQQEGHTFYVVNFPTANQTWVFDVATGKWHERGAFNVQTGEVSRHRSNCFAFFGGRCLVGDYANGRLYALELSNYTDDGEAILRLRASGTAAIDQRLVRYGSLLVDVEAGVGLNTGLGEDPKLMMRHSDDGGHTWSNRRVAPMGRVGQYGRRAKFNRCGAGRNRVWEVSTTEKVKVVVLGAYAEVAA